jgi:hypothetical protein
MRLVASLLLVGAIAMVAGCASTPTAPPAVNVTGKWAGNWTYPDPALGGSTLSGTFQQDGGNLSGNFLIIGGGNTVRYPAATIIGFVSGRQVILSQPSSGTLTVNESGNKMAGWINGLDQAKVTLRKQ